MTIGFAQEWLNWKDNQKAAADIERHRASNLVDAHRGYCRIGPPVNSGTEAPRPDAVAGLVSVPQPSRMCCQPLPVTLPDRSAPTLHCRSDSRAATIAALSFVSAAVSSST